MSRRLEVALEAAKSAGVVIEEYFETSLEKRQKEDTSIVTEADSASETIIIEKLSSLFPNDTIVGEEGGGQKGDNEYEWFVDPLDGTSNFANALPLFAVSIGLMKEGRPVLGVVYNPVIPSLFYAEEGEGAYWNEKLISVSNQQVGQGVVTLASSRIPEDKKHSTGLVATLNEQLGASVRVLGCIALDLSYLARGGIEGVINLGTKEWDYTAGAAILLEAGGKITDLAGGEWNPQKGYFVASNGTAHEELLSVTKNLYERLP